MPVHVETEAPSVMDDGLQVNLTKQTSCAKALVIGPVALMNTIHIQTFVGHTIFIATLETVWLSDFPILIVRGK